MTDIFVYGVLAKRRVLFLVTRTKVATDPAKVLDYREGRSPTGIPTILPEPGEQVTGLLATNVPDIFLKRLDGYFGPNYQRKSIEVISNGRKIEAQAHLLKPKPITLEGANIEILRAGCLSEHDS